MIYDIAVIGGGAAGLMAAGVPGSANVAIIEKNSRAGKKILATGGGRCNFTNINADIKSYQSADAEIAGEILENIGPQYILEYFHSLGLMHRLEEGRAYPYTNQASTVLDCLRNKNKSLGVLEITDFNVIKLTKSGGVFDIVSDKNEVLQSKKVIAATGGLAGLKPGEKGGYYLLSGFGHKVSKLSPALVPMKMKGSLCKSLGGIRVRGAVSAVYNSRVLGREEGEILFTGYGLSGIAVMQLSGFFNRYSPLVFELDFFPALTEDELRRELAGRRENGPTGLLMEEYLTGAVNKKISVHIIKELGIKRDMPCAGLRSGQIARIAGKLKHMAFEPSGTAGFLSAQVTEGGACLSEFEPETMESRLVKGLYACGEVLDVNGLCGGYNLHWAWATGLLAGRAAKGEINA